MYVDYNADARTYTAHDIEYGISVTRLSREEAVEVLVKVVARLRRRRRA